ncbi:Nif3-like dinuclear metal center hexameric protein [Candidatus Vondammii sp. HM_W22]|uniref:Nif3-like dinuclear metal center hexameric protein n=1 Tax=Candidatus Vondammii sp. HM_W22 TaxID=2687299 RepID=UPI001F13F5CF|nr:Nif3-like dinuclear metal center hexameric protein [Candidatus Vondammii sp. HM_W22]
MESLYELERYCSGFLNASAFNDYCPNGLQVDAGVTQVCSLVSGVTASQALIDAAVEADADLLLVHHGYFWKGEPPALIGVKGCRVRTLMSHGISLLAYHLPLDAHPILGNNRLLGDLLGFLDVAPIEEGALIWQATLELDLTPDGLGLLLASKLGRKPLQIEAGDRKIRKVGWCTGAAQGAIEQAAAIGLDAFITGEVSEFTVHLARELGIHFFAAGHHATERSGASALGHHLSEKFNIKHQFIDVPNPV